MSLARALVSGQALSAIMIFSIIVDIPFLNKFGSRFLISKS